MVLAFESGFPFNFAGPPNESSPQCSLVTLKHIRHIGHNDIPQTDRNWQTERQHTFCACPSAHFLVLLYSSFSSTAMSSPSLHTMQDQSQNKLLHYSTLACAHKHTHTYTHFSWTPFFTVQARTWSQMNNHHSGFSAHRSGYITIH